MPLTARVACLRQNKNPPIPKTDKNQPEKQPEKAMAANLNPSHYSCCVRIITLPFVARANALQVKLNLSPTHPQ